MPESVAKYWPILAALFVGAGGASSVVVTGREGTAVAGLGAALYFVTGRGVALYFVSESSHE